MKLALEVINDLQDKGLIKEYAIGGGVAGIFYTEPCYTKGLDIFVYADSNIFSGLISFSAIYDYLVSRGFKWEGEHIRVFNTLVQFLPANDLELDAIRKANEIDYQGVNTKVFTAEHVIAIALKTGRPKDMERVRNIVDQYKELDYTKLYDILKRYGLEEKFNEFRSKNTDR